MKRGSIRLLGLLIMVLSALPGRAELVTYPGPPGLSASREYTVQICQGNRTRESFVYVTYAKWRTNRSKTTSWTTFSFSGRVTVRVTKLNGPFTSCKILPSGYGIEPRIEGRSVLFDLDQARKVSVEFDNDIRHPVLVFADPPETNVPSPEDPNVIYFSPGVHTLEQTLDIPSGTTVYLAGGAYVKGRLASNGAKRVKIIGRGVLSGEEFESRTEHLVRVQDVRNLLIEGITLVDSPHFNLSLRGSDHVVRNVKMIGWHFSTDGVVTGYHGLVEDCFFKVNDDAIKLYHSDMVVRNCVIWQMENGAPFQISWNMPSDNRGFRVENVDVIRVEHEWDNRNEAVFDAIHGGRGHMSDYVFENIRVENADWRLFYITIDQNEFADSSKGMGHISDLVFRDITVNGPVRRPSTIKGWDADHRVSNVLFENLKIDGEYITSPQEGGFRIDPHTTSNIRFVVTRP